MLHRLDEFRRIHVWTLRGSYIKLSATASRVSTLQSNQIISGQAVDNTLQLNKQGGGRIDIPLPESSPTTISIEPIEINDTSSFNITRTTKRVEYNASDPLNIKIALDDNTIVEFNNTVRMFSISDYDTLRDAFYLRILPCHRRD